MPHISLNSGKAIKVNVAYNQLLIILPHSISLSLLNLTKFNEKSENNKVS